MTASVDAKAGNGLLHTVKLLVRTLRPKQWTKNLIIFAPAIFALKIHDPVMWLKATLCFLSFCCVSGALYGLNDILDAPKDRKHPTKCRRPVAAGALSVRLASIFCSIVLLLGFVLALLIRPAVLLVVLVYIGLHIAYCVRLKHIPIIDISCIATGFVLRAVAGAVAVHTPVSAWFLLCTGLGSLFIALEKRRQELKMLGSNAAEVRPVLAGYPLEFINRLETVILPTLVISYILYTVLSWHGQWMMLTIPFILYGVARYLKLSSDEHLVAAPEDVVLKDGPIQATLLLWIVTCVLVLYGIVPRVPFSVVHYLDSLGRSFF